MILRPQRNFTVVRQIANHTDTDTYYVRAVIRNAYTDEIIATLDLDDKGGQRFSKNWQVPADPSGLGLEISIVTSVYTDSGYTTKSDNYGDEENSHLIEERFVGGRGGGAVGGGIDSRTLRRVITEELDKRTPEPIKIPKPEKMEMRWNEVLEALNEVKRIASEKPVIPETSLTPVLSRINDVITEIRNKEVTPETDLTPIAELIQRNDEIDEENRQMMIKIVQGIEDNFEKIIKREVEAAVGAMQFVSQFSTIAIPKKQPKNEQREIDIDSLTS